MYVLDGITTSHSFSLLAKCTKIMENGRTTASKARSPSSEKVQIDSVMAV